MESQTDHRMGFISTSLSFSGLGFVLSLFRAGFDPWLGNKDPAGRPH